MTCLMFKAAKTYKKMPKNEIMLECFLACQKNDKTIKLQKKMYCMRFSVLPRFMVHIVCT